MKKWPQKLFSNLAALVLGMLLTLGFAPFEIFPLGVLAPAGLLILWLRVPAKRAFLLGFLFGIGFFSTSVYWVFHSIHVFGGMPSLPATAITILFILILAVFPALVGYLLNVFFPIFKWTKVFCAFPSIWVISEWIRSWIFTGFPWLFIGYTQTNAPLKGYAPIGSVYTVSLLTLMTSGLVVYALKQYKQKNYKLVYLNLFAALIIWTLGSWLDLIRWTTPQGAPISVGLVQGNIPQNVKWSPEYLQLSLDRYSILTETLWNKEKPPTMIVWPEAAVPLPLNEAENFIILMDGKAREHHTFLILGIPIEAPNERGFYNSIIVLGQGKQVYIKRRLVPFGEYIPMLPFISRFFMMMNLPMSNLYPGHLQQKPLEIANITMIPSICYEIAFPELMNSKDPKIGAILTITNDAWFGKSSAQAEHLQMAVMRAIELRRPVIFVGNDGITAIINPQGQLTAAIPPYQTEILESTFQPMQGLTPWMRFGMDPLLITLFLLLLIAKLNERDKSNARTISTA